MHEASYLKSWVRAGMYELVMFDGRTGEELLERGTSALLGIFLSSCLWYGAIGIFVTISDGQGVRTW